MSRPRAVNGGPLLDNVLEGAAIDLERVIEKAIETGTFLEINSQPDRLDLNDVQARVAGEAGLRLVIDSDAHQISALDYVELGVGQADPVAALFAAAGMPPRSPARPDLAGTARALHIEGRG